MENCWTQTDVKEIREIFLRCYFCSFQPTHTPNTCEPPHDKTNKMTVRPAKTQISLGIRPVWSESSLCAQCVAKDPNSLHADSEDSDLSLRWAHRPFYWFCHEAAHVIIMKVASCLFISWRCTTRRLHRSRDILRDTALCPIQDTCWCKCFLKFSSVSVRYNLVFIDTVTWRLCIYVSQVGGLLVRLVPILEQQKTMRKGTFVSWAVRSAVVV